MAQTSKSAIEADLVRELAELLEETGLSEIEYGKDGLNIRVAKTISASSTNRETISDAVKPLVSTIPLDKPQAEETSLSDHPGVVKSPMVGVVFLAPEPTAPAFVKLGEEVSEGQTLFLIEAMKVFNPIAAPKSGKVTCILVNSETPVEFGEPLAIIE